MINNKKKRTKRSKRKKKDEEDYKTIVSQLNDKLMKNQYHHPSLSQVTTSSRAQVLSSSFQDIFNDDLFTNEKPGDNDDIDADDTDEKVKIIESYQRQVMKLEKTTDELINENKKLMKKHSDEIQKLNNINDVLLDDLQNKLKESEVKINDFEDRINEMDDLLKESELKRDTLEKEKAEGVKKRYAMEMQFKQDYEISENKLKCEISNLKRKNETLMNKRNELLNELIEKTSKKSIASFLCC